MAETKTMMVIYLNNAGQAILSREVTEAGVAALERMPWETHGSDDQQLIRGCFASLIDAESDDIAIMPSTAFAITMAARNIQRTCAKSQGKILLLQDQFNSAVYPWQQIVEESNGLIQLEIIPHPAPNVNDGWTKAILDRINPSVIVTCLPPLHWSNGALIDLEKIGRACRENDVALVVDATQGKNQSLVHHYLLNISLTTCLIVNQRLESCKYRSKKSNLSF
jgi:selenocysteine lyase/cysteine desulfurase